jgi:hypothetical protein
MMRIQGHVKRVRRQFQDAHRIREPHLVQIEPDLNRTHAVVEHRLHSVCIEDLVERLTPIGAQVEALRRRPNQERFRIGNLARSLPV